MSYLARLTRGALNKVSQLHSAALVRVLDKAEAAEDSAQRRVDQAERFSRWANEVKRAAREDYAERIHHTNRVMDAVQAELETLPAVVEAAREVREVR